MNVLKESSVIFPTLSLLVSFEKSLNPVVIIGYPYSKVNSVNISQIKDSLNKGLPDAANTKRSFCVGGSAAPCAFDLDTCEL